jgi:hypothetical protein
MYDNFHTYFYAYCMRNKCMIEQRLSKYHKEVIFVPSLQIRDLPEHIYQKIVELAKQELKKHIPGSYCFIGEILTDGRSGKNPPGAAAFPHYAGRRFQLWPEHS